MMYKKDCLMEIYTDHEDTFSVGFYLSNFDEYSLFLLLDCQGRYDGVYLIKNDFIKTVDYETEYLKKIALYMEFWNGNFIDFKSALKDISTTEEILKYIKDNSLLSSFKIQQEDFITGYIEKIEKSSIRVNTVDLETISILKKEILLLEIDSIDNRLLNYANLKKQLF